MTRLTCPSCNGDLSRSSWPKDRLMTTAVPCGRCEALDHLSATARIYEARHAETWKGRFTDTLITATSIPTLGNETGIPEKIAQAARVNRIPEEIRRQLPSTFRKAMAEGSLVFPGGKGFGLDGDVAVGKTYAVAAYVRRWLWSWFDRAVEHWDWADGQLPDARGLVTWATWPRTYSWIQAHAIEGEAISAFTRIATKARLLILDDLGREGMPAKPAGVPFAHRVLDDLISLRYDRALPVIWTANNAKEFSKFYDAALVSRLLDGSPMIRVEGESLRSI